jgi:hypothetical protein
MIDETNHNTVAASMVGVTLQAKALNRIGYPC